MESLAPASISMYKDMRDGYVVEDVLKKQEIDRSNFSQIVEVNTF